MRGGGGYLAAAGAAGVLVWLLASRDSAASEKPPAKRPSPSGPPNKEGSSNVKPSPQPAGGSSPPAAPAPPPHVDPTLETDPNGKDDQTALARMLASETSDKRVQVVIGWITLTRARRLRLSVFRMLTGLSGEYGSRVLNGERRYASTSQPPNRDSRTLAQQLLDGQVQPAEAIRKHGISPWVELLFPNPPDATELERRAQQLLAVQRPIGKRGDFGGIWARIEGSNWYLYSRSAPIVAVRSPEQTALARLSAVPVVAPLDSPPGSRLDVDV